MSALQGLRCAPEARWTVEATGSEVQRMAGVHARYMKTSRLPGVRVTALMDLGLGALIGIGNAVVSLVPPEKPSREEPGAWGRNSVHFSLGSQPIKL